MQEAVIIAASRREHELYGELTAAYRALAEALNGEATPDPGALAEHQARAEAATAALRTLAGTLAPTRLTGSAVPVEARNLWRASAALAAEAARANSALQALAAARRADLAERLSNLAAGRQGLSAYRPTHTRTPRLTDHRA